MRRKKVLLSLVTNPVFILAFAMVGGCSRHPPVFSSDKSSMVLKDEEGEFINGVLFYTYEFTIDSVKTLGAFGIRNDTLYFLSSLSRAKCMDNLFPFAVLNDYPYSYVIDNIWANDCTLCSNTICVEGDSIQIIGQDTLWYVTHTQIDPMHTEFIIAPDSTFSTGVDRSNLKDVKFQFAISRKKGLMLAKSNLLSAKHAFCFPYATSR